MEKLLFKPIFEFSYFSKKISFLRNSLNSLVFLCIFAAIFNASILPTENILLGKFTPQKYHGVIYGIKYILAFGSGPIAVLLISEIYSLTLEFAYLFIINGVMMAIISIFILFLPYQSNSKLTTQN